MSTPSRSLAPLWLTLGFAAGLVFGWAAFRDAVTPPAAAPPIAPKAPIAASALRAVERMFERWGGYAVWENDVTEIAAWDARRKRHSDFYEVRRHDGKFYFRSLVALTRPVIDHGVSATMPIAFTEPRWMRDQFYREHPDYDPASAPRVDLPPRPPDRYADTPAKSDRANTTTPSLTPGAGD